MNPFPFIGIDPDLHHLSIAVVDHNNRIIDLKVLEVPESFTAQRAIAAMARQIKAAAPWMESFHPSYYVVEAQELYLTGPYKTPNPRSILHLATVAGAALAHAPTGAEVIFPTPVQWKGSVDKQIHQARVLHNAGLPMMSIGKGAGYCYPINNPLGWPTFLQGRWKHLADAVGLAQYGVKLLLEKQRKQFSQHVLASAIISKR